MRYVQVVGPWDSFLWPQCNKRVLTCLRIGAGVFVFCVFHKEINTLLSVALAKEFNRNLTNSLHSVSKCFCRRN